MRTRRGRPLRRGIVASLAVALLVASCDVSRETGPKEDGEGSPARPGIKQSAAPSYGFSITTFSIFLSDVNWATDAKGIRYFRFSPNGHLLGRTGYPTGSFQLSGMPVAGVRVDELAAQYRNQCTALVKDLTGAPVTSSWRAGGRVVDGNGSTGTAIAIFSSDGLYKGVHAAILWQLNSDGSIVVIEENVPLEYGVRFRTIKKLTNNTWSTDISDASSYRVVK